MRKVGEEAMQSTDARGGELADLADADRLPSPASRFEQQTDIKTDGTKRYDIADSDDDLFEVTATSMPGHCSLVNVDGKSELSQDDCNNFAKHNCAENSEAVIKRNHFVKGLLNTKEAQHLSNRSWKIDLKSRLAPPE